jgi:predicted O-linked N-acetylglucosamine transferase (SPINDLY family)
MLLAEFLPQPNVTEVSNNMVRTVINDEPMKLPAISSESTPINDNYSSITSIKIPLVSFEPILATSPNYILANEFTKRKNQFVLFNDHLQKFITRSVINKPILDALWYDNGQQFLILTETNIFAFYPTTKNIQLINDLMPVNNKTFKCFTLLNQSTLLIGYNEWSAEYIDKWKQIENGLWKLIERQQLVLTSNEFIGNMLTITEDDCTNIAITIYNNLTEQWRLELRNAETLICYKAILLPGSNVMHDYRIIPIKNAESNIKWLIFSSANSHIIAMDSNWKKIRLNYKNPVQRMAVFNENYLIIRTKERIDIHLFG